MSTATPTHATAPINTPSFAVIATPISQQRLNGMLASWGLRADDPHALALTPAIPVNLATLEAASKAVAQRDQGMTPAGTSPMGVTARRLRH